MVVSSPRPLHWAERVREIRQAAMQGRSEPGGGRVMEDDERPTTAAETLLPYPHGACQLDSPESEQLFEGHRLPGPC
jgi:hypothetical protein